VDIPVSNPLLVMNKTENAIASNHNTRYILIGTSLLVLTVLTVWTSYFTVTVGVSIVIALIIATIKGSLVASFFMHLVSEKKLILIVLIITVVFFFALIFLPLSDTMDNVGNPNVY
jgi:cytochrome c oxidase subunit 4